MAALTARRATDSRNEGKTTTRLMKASTTIYAGSLVMLDSNGLALPAAASAGNKGVVGVAVETVTSAASGSYYVTVREGEFLFDATSIAQANVNSKMYASDDHTIDETQGLNEPVAGVLAEYVSATSGWVKVGATESLL
jgi:hypothetical protein